MVYVNKIQRESARRQTQSLVDWIHCPVARTEIKRHRPQSKGLGQYSGGMGSGEASQERSMAGVVPTAS